MRVAQVTENEIAVIKEALRFYISTSYSARGDALAAEAFSVIARLQWEEK